MGLSFACIACWQDMAVFSLRSVNNSSMAASKYRRAIMRARNSAIAQVNDNGARKTGRDWRMQRGDIKNIMHGIKRMRPQRRARGVHHRFAGSCMATILGTDSTLAGVFIASLAIFLIAIEATDTPCDRSLIG